jgi:hypothetical protein
MPPVGFELTISAGKRPQTYVLDQAATGPAKLDIRGNNNYNHPAEACSVGAKPRAIYAVLRPEILDTLCKCDIARKFVKIFSKISDKV